MHAWDVTPGEAIRIQITLAGNVQTSGEISHPLLVAGVDVAVDRFRKTGTASVVVLSFPDLKVVETRIHRGPVTFPYIPGLLSFREIPLLVKAFEQVTLIPDIVLVDGQGIAHPRRMGLATHLGLMLDVPTIGCAKSRLCGVFAEPCLDSGSFSPLLDDAGETIGAAVRTRKNIKPIFISPGHQISLDQSIFWTLQCCGKYRLPEPTRQAHIAAKSSLISA